MAKKKAAKQGTEATGTEAQSGTSSPKPQAPSLPALGAGPPAEAFLNPATLPQFLPQPLAGGAGLPPVPPLPPSPLLPPGKRVMPSVTVTVKDARTHNPTFDAPPPDIADARGRAQNLRAVLGHAMQGLLQAVAEIEQADAFLTSRPDLSREFERFDISLAEAKHFRREALDVIEAFKPMKG